MTMMPRALSITCKTVQLHANSPVSRPEVDPKVTTGIGPVLIGPLWHREREREGERGRERGGERKERTELERRTRGREWRAGRTISVKETFMFALIQIHLLNQRFQPAAEGESSSSSFDGKKKKLNSKSTY